LVLKEHTQLMALEGGKAEIHIISLAEVYAQPGAVLEDLLLALRPHIANFNRDLPAFLPHDGLDSYVEFLKDSGLNLDTGLIKSLDQHGDNP